MSKPYESMTDCWKRIGVWGNETPRCPELDRVIHCRNCEVFTHAGRDLLEKEIPTAYRKEWTDIMSAEKEDGTPGTISAMIFRLEDEWLAINTQALSEVLSSEGLLSHSLPHRKNPVLSGIINIRGEIQLLISLKRLLEIEDSKDPEHRNQTDEQMIVLEGPDGDWVFPVDEVFGIYRIHPNAFENVPVTVAKAQSTFTQGIFYLKNRHVAYLDDELLFFSLLRSVQ